jgi:hypothetical protein
MTIHNMRWSNIDRFGLALAARVQDTMQRRMQFPAVACATVAGAFVTLHHSIDDTAQFELVTEFTTYCHLYCVCHPERVSDF